MNIGERMGALKMIYSFNYFYTFAFVLYDIYYYILYIYIIYIYI